jgi:tetratricopeptide (TPR) repeat protein
MKTNGEEQDMSTLRLAQETIPPGEAEYTEDLIATMKGQMIKDNPSGIMRRDAHAKMHGVVRAQFIVGPNLPQELRIGVFKEPKTYQALIRFSNGAGPIKPDIARDIRGMAIKLMGVPGEKILEQEKDEQTHDFILASTSVFMTKDVKETSDGAKALFGSIFAKIWFLTHLRVAWNFYKSNLKFANPLQIRYFSCTPYRFGSDSAVKYSAIPQFITPDTIPDDPSDDYLRLAMMKQLKTGEALFDFTVQLQTDADAMPIEDAGHEWPESLSPFRKVATIRIVQQDFDSTEQTQFGENLSFSPWHALPEHRPLGGINRARKVIYAAISKFRHERNQAPRKEPSSWEIVLPPASKAPGMNASPRPVASPEAMQALERRDFPGAIGILESELGRQAGGDVHALLALAYFQSEQYEPAVRHYAAALELDPHHADWRDMLAVAQANATAAINVHVPEIYYFDRDALLAAPAVRVNALPAPLPPRARPGLSGRMRIALGNGLGGVATVLMHTATQLWGRLAGYRDAVWTNWYRRSLTFAILTLAYMREQLNARNLGTSYPHGTLTGFQREGQTPPPGVTHFRTADGSWNNLADPKEGAAGTRFLRNVDLAAIRPEKGTQLLTPNPREISRKLLTRDKQETGEPVMKEVPFLNLLAASWIQFMNGDWINHGEIRYNDVIEVPLPEDDPARTRYWQTKMFIGKTQADPTRMDGREEAATSSINEVTHWWDGSQIYGSDQPTQDRLRSGVDGKLRLNGDGTLPLDRKGIEETGFTRNWWVGLTMLHTLFAREHNAVCDHLRAAYPDWDDNRLFNVARLINAAVMAKIHSVEWTPAILPNPALDAALNANWYGILTNLLRRGKARKTVADINVHNPELGGIVGNPIDKHGRGFGLSEEFTEIYRLHSLLPETIALRRREGMLAVPISPQRLVEDTRAGAAEHVPFHATRQSGSGKITRRYALADLFFSFGTQHPGQLVLNNYPRFMQELSIPGNPFFDMGTVDIVRARERGVPRYNEFRRQLGLNPIRTFEDLTNNTEHVRKLKEVYGGAPDDVEKLDLLIGTLAEGYRPTNFGFGETMFQIFILNASRRLQADRFYTDCYNEDVYTPEGLRWIDDTDFKTAILRQYPELASTGLANIKNGFEPWDTGEALDPARHPLRACDPELRADPWRGDAHRCHA